jgi:hypothetical protein
MKTKLIGILGILTLVFAFVLAAYAQTFVLSPHGPVQVALYSVGGGSATWYPVEPRVYDGSYSVELYTGTTPYQDGGAILIGPLDIKLKYFNYSMIHHWITFWTYHRNSADGPYVNIVLDNGRTMEGIGSTTVSGTVKTETGQGYPSADLWIQMKPLDEWYTSFTTDPLLKGLGNITNPVSIAAWQKAFPSANVIQIQIIYGIWGSTGQKIYIDDACINGMIVKLEPQTTSWWP